MARHIRFAGLASIVVVDESEEIDALLDDPNLDRTYRTGGPLLNRVLISRLRHALFHDGHALLSFAPRQDESRASRQTALAARLDELAERRPWDGKAIRAMSAYVATGADRDTALAALTYTMAYPFLGPATADHLFEPAKFSRLFGLFEILQKARSPWTGIYLRLRGADKRASREILQTLNGEDYGLHAVGITLANSVPILDHVRALLARSTPARNGNSKLDWNSVRVAPVAVTRQNKAPCKLPGIAVEIPVNSLIQFKMRQALRPESPAGFEFASAHWSFCPASRYVQEIFALVYETAQNGASA